jgi:hypothetical protein
MVDWQQVWQDTADAIGDHGSSNRGHLVTEDAVRWALMLALQRAGIDQQRILFEHRVPGVGPIDLVVSDGDALAVAVELKYPRDPRATNAPDTMTLGELLNDFYRLARVDAAERYALQVVGSRLAGYLSRRRDTTWTADVGTTWSMEADLPSRLPATARLAMKAASGSVGVNASCVFRSDVLDLTVAAYAVTPVVGMVAANAVPAMAESGENRSYLEQTRGSGRMTGKYDALGAHLARQKEATIRLTFVDVERIIGSSLPGSAKKYREWWSNDRRRMPGPSWLRVGWRTVEVDLHLERVQFQRQP